MIGRSTVPAGTRGWMKPAVPGLKTMPANVVGQRRDARLVRHLRRAPVRGSWLESGDRHGAPQVAVVDRGSRRGISNGANPSAGSLQRASHAAASRVYQIVGLTEDARYDRCAPSRRRPLPAAGPVRDLSAGITLAVPRRADNPSISCQPLHALGA